FDCLVVETMRRFQYASPKSHQPALSPTRGSGDGAVAENAFGCVGTLLVLADDALPPAQAPSISRVAAAVSGRWSERCGTTDSGWWEGNSGRCYAGGDCKSIRRMRSISVI